MGKKVVVLSTLFWFLIQVIYSQNLFDTNDTDKQKTWVDSVYNTLNQDQKIGQLFMIAAYSNKGERYYGDLENLVTEFHVGGLIFFQGGPIRQAQLINRYQKAASVPLLIGMDLEWGMVISIGIGVNLKMCK